MLERARHDGKTEGVAANDGKFEKTISRMEFQRIATKWIALNNEYDRKIEDFFEHARPKKLSDQQITEMKAMQKELFELETSLFEVAEGKISVREN